MGDWDAVVREGKEGNFVYHTLSKRNGSGDKLVEFCAKHKLVIAITLFKDYKKTKIYVDNAWRYRKISDRQLIC